MHRHALVATILLAVVALVVPASATAAPPVLVNACLDQPGEGSVAAPQAWASGCLGDAPRFLDLVWTNWGSPSATATGRTPLPYACTDHEDQDEQAACFANPPSAPLTLTVSEIRSCFSPAGPARFYAALDARWTIPEGTPGYTSGEQGGTMAAECSPASWSVRRDWRRGVGPITILRADSWASINDFRAIFGEPRQRESGASCTSTWPKLGLTVSSVGYGETSACYDAGASELRLADKRWRLWNGVRVGTPARTIRRLAIRPLRPGSTASYVLTQRRSDCSGGMVPSIVARMARGRVSAIVLTGNCE